MANYKVIVSALSGKGNRIYKDGDIVKDSDFVEGRALELVKGGFLEEIKEKVEDKPKAEKEVTKPKADKK